MTSNLGDTAAVRAIGRYRAISEIGRGAMGVVYRGFDPIIGRTVALKTLSLDSADAQAREFRDRLYREAAAAGALSHPNIVTIYDIVEDGGTTAVAMEFIEGRSLAAIIAERAPLPLDVAVEILDHVSSALDYAGSQGIVHRDIKPANILVTTAGRAKVTDFGVARLALSTMTQAGTVLGSPSYMSPEQVRGLPLDGRSDLFSAAVVFFEMITRERPFTGNDIATTMYRIAHEPPTPPSQFNPAVGPEIAAVLERAFAKSPADRYQTGADLVSELRAAAGLGTARASSPSLAALAAAPPPMPPIVAPIDIGPATAAALSGAPAPVAPIPVGGGVEAVPAQPGGSALPPIPASGPARAAAAAGPDLALPTIPLPPEAARPGTPSSSGSARRPGSGRRGLLMGGAAVAAVALVAAGAWLVRGGAGPGVDAPPAEVVESAPSPQLGEPAAPVAPPAAAVDAPSTPAAPAAPPQAPAAAGTQATPNVGGRGTGASAPAKPGARPLPAQQAAATHVTSAPPLPTVSAPAQAKSADGRVYLITEVDVKPAVLAQVAPQFPEDAAKQNVQDVVVLQVLVDANGRPETIKVLRGSRKAASLDAAAVAAVRQWTFSPAKKSGQPVPCWFNVGVPFPPVK